MSSERSRAIVKKFKNRGWTINSAALKGLLSVLDKEENELQELENIMTEISDRMDKKQIRSSIIDVEIMEDIADPDLDFGWH